jgi:hypothetical protein
MPLISPTSLPKRQPLSLLLIGPPGGGKTTLALQFPNVQIIDIDLNIDGPINVLRSKSKLNEIKYETILIDDEQKPVDGVDQQWTRLMTKLTQACRDPWTKTVVVDGLTRLNQLIIDMVLKDAGKKDMEIQLWIPFRQRMLGVFNTMRGSGKHSILLCHEEYKYSAAKAGKEVVDKRGPAMDSKLKDQLAGFFTDMWRCWGQPAPVKLVNGVLVQGNLFKVATIPTGLDELKNSYGLPAEIDVTEKGFAAINEHIKLV